MPSLILCQISYLKQNPNFGFIFNSVPFSKSYNLINQKCSFNLVRILTHVLSSISEKGVKKKLFTDMSAIPPLPLPNPLLRTLSEKVVKFLVVYFRSLGQYRDVKKQLLADFCGQWAELSKLRIHPQNQLFLHALPKPMLRIFQDLDKFK